MAEVVVIPGLELGKLAVSPWFMAGATALVTACDAVCRRVDAEAGAEQLRLSNAFAASFALVMSLMSLDYVFLQLGQGSWEEIEAVLHPSRGVALGPSEAAAGLRICVMMFAYMVSDLVERVMYSQLDVRMVTHHLACLVGLVLAIGFGHSPVYCVALSISELSTPAVCLFEVIEAEGSRMAKFMDPTGYTLNVVFPVRVAWFSWLCWIWISELQPQDLEGPTRNSLGVGCVVVLTLLNWSWYLQLLIGT
ncbi:Hypothetical protein SCF082_LOCUS19872, partial [Durusdinium trenchii]